MATTISVIIPAYNSESTLESCLMSITEASRKFDINLEIIVVDDGSSDNTASVAQQFQVKVLRLPTNRGRNFARCYGATHARSEIIVNIDSDIVISAESLQLIADHFRKNPDSMIISGSLAFPEYRSDPVSFFKNSKLSVLYSKLPRRSAFLYGGVFAFRRSLIADISSKASYADDTEIAQRLASKGIYTELLHSLKVMHLKTYTVKLLIREEFRMGTDWGLIAVGAKVWQRPLSRRSALLHCARHLNSFSHTIISVGKVGLYYLPLHLALTLLSGSALVTGCLAGLCRAVFDSALKDQEQEGDCLTLSEIADQ